MHNQDELRKMCKILKWDKGINYYEIANAISMNKQSFYNFISGRRVKISHQMQWRLENYLKEENKNE